MANITSITSVARPYAKAAFYSALEENDIKFWSALLRQAAMVVQDKSVQIFLADPRLDRMVWYDFLCAVCKQQMFDSGDNFLRLIVLRCRMLVLPEIARLFERYCAEHTHHITAQAFSAIPLTKKEMAALTKGLEKRLQRKVKLDCFVDKDLLGGLMIRVDDLVIDSSVCGKLQRLRAALVN